MTRALFSFVFVASFCASTLAGRQATAQTGEYPEAVLSGLQWRDVGPMRGGRSFAVAGVESEPNTFYMGSVGGGVWKTENDGRTWTPISDTGIPIGSIGAIAVAGSDPKVVYVGTGEPDIRGQHSYGNGMYKSVDAGKTWTHIGLEDSKHIGRIVVDPANAERVYAAVLGQPGALSHVWIYLIGPLVGGALAAAVFRVQVPNAIETKRPPIPEP